VERIVKLSSEIQYYHWDDFAVAEREQPLDVVSALHEPSKDRIRDAGWITS
jgi:hypothetical protein